MEIITDKDKLNRTIDCFREALKENNEVAEAFGYFKLVVNGKLPYPESEDEIRIGMRPVPISQQDRLNNIYRGMNNV